MLCARVTKRCRVPLALAHWQLQRGSRHFHTQPSVLVRDYISSTLYDQEKGYFTTTDCVYSSPEGPDQRLDFTKLFGKLHYVQKVHQLYQTAGKEQSWLTPVELFKPWYSYAIANYITSNHIDSHRNAPLRVVEIGGGNGTNAYHIMGYVRDNYPELYKCMEYTLIEISPTLANRQDKLIGSAHAQERYQIVNQSVLDLDAEQLGGDAADHRYLVAMEVLDNLPHDKIVYKGESPVRVASDDLQLKWESITDWSEVWVSQHKNGNGAKTNAFHEELRPLQDSLITRTAELFLGKPLFPLTTESDPPQRFPNLNVFERWRNSAKNAVLLQRREMEANVASDQDVAVFVPTGAVRLLDQVKLLFSDHTLIAADFDCLPAPEPNVNESQKHQVSSSRPPGSLLGCVNFPLVSTRNGKTGEVTDHLTYFVPHGSCDIFFQTDFERLSYAYSRVVGGTAQVFTSKTFLNQYADTAKTRTRSGYNPLLQDYDNTKFLIAHQCE